MYCRLNEGCCYCWTEVAIVWIVVSCKWRTSGGGCKDSRVAEMWLVASLWSACQLTFPYKQQHWSSKSLAV
jgi:hypothetical protein